MVKTYFTQRNIGIDHLRALTMFVMIFVNDFWKIHDVPHWLEHAKYGEDFMGLSDIVFPCFLFVLGMSIPYAIERRYSKNYTGESTIGHIFSRTLALLVMGLFITNSEARLSPAVNYKIGVYWLFMALAFILIWNQYPGTSKKKYAVIFTFLKFIGVLILLFLAITFRSTKGEVFDAHWGILGAIGWTYLICALIYVFIRERLNYLIPVWIVFVLICILGSRMSESWGASAILSFPRPNAYNELLHVLHIGNGALPAFTMGGIIFAIISARFAKIESRKKIAFVIMLMSILFIAGFISRRFWILSKISATPPWIFYVSAIAIGLYALLNWLSVKGWDNWLTIIKPAGTATLTCYLLPYVFYGFADSTGVVLPGWFTHYPWGIVNCLCFAFIIIGVVWILGRMQIKLKI